MGQGDGSGATQTAELVPCRRRHLTAAGGQNLVLPQGRHERTIGWQVGRGRGRSEMAHRPVDGRLAVAQVDRAGRHAEQVRRGVEHPPGQGRQVHELFDGLAQLLERPIELRLVAAVAAVQHPPQPRPRQVQAHRQHQGAAADPEGLLD